MRRRPAAREHLVACGTIEFLPPCKLTLDVTESGYWFMIKDTADPCGFPYISHQAGVIFSAEPIR